MAYFRIKEIASEKEINLKDLAKRIGINPSCLSSIVTGRSWPRIETLEKIASVLNVKVEDLFITSQTTTEQKPGAGETSVFCPHCGKLINIKIQTS